MEVSWTCFHCGETFDNRECAALHFGVSEELSPACRLAATEGGLVEVIRRQEAELHAFRIEDTENSRLFYELGSKHAAELREAEDRGYAKALRDLDDGKIEPEHARRLLGVLSTVAQRL